MSRRIVGSVLAAVTAAGVVAVTPATATASTVSTVSGTSGSTSTASTISAATTGLSAKAVTAAPQLIRYKIQFGRCKDTCRIKVRITNISRKRLFDVRLNARLWVNGKKVGSCNSYIGAIRPKGVRSGGCTVRSAKLARLWDRYLDGEIDFNYRTRTNVTYRYYR
jgi:hypothetical protein